VSAHPEKSRLHSRDSSFNGENQPTIAVNRP